jgi:hypothetical protein
MLARFLSLLLPSISSNDIDLRRIAVASPRTELRGNLDCVFLIEIIYALAARLGCRGPTGWIRNLSGRSSEAAP